VQSTGDTICTSSSTARNFGLAAIDSEFGILLHSRTWLGRKACHTGTLSPQPSLAKAASGLIAHSVDLAPVLAWCSQALILLRYAGGFLRAPPKPAEGSL
jgi:hypothetical protein